MTPSLWGLATGLSWGVSDFMARYSGRALGAGPAALAILGSSAVVLTLWMWSQGFPVPADPSKLALALVAGALIAAAVPLFYFALGSGPVSVVGPIVGANPAIIVLIAVMAGARPSTMQYAGMGVTLVGATLVARAGDAFAHRGDFEPAALKRALLSALAACLVYAFAVSAAQHSVPLIGEVETLWILRVTAAVVLATGYLIVKGRPRMPARWLPFLAAQATIETAGYLFLFLGSAGPGAEIAAVTSSTFIVITAILARLVLGERIGLAQWGGIALVFGGVATLSAG